MASSDGEDPGPELRDLPTDPAELDAWLAAERLPYMPLPRLEKMDALAAEFLSGIESWTSARRIHALGSTERLLLTWMRKRLPDIRATFSDFRAFIDAEAPGHPAWGIMHFITHWSVRRNPMVLSNAISLQMVIFMKAIEDQEREVRPQAIALIRRIRALKTAASAFRTELEGQQQPGRRAEFWTRLEQRLSGTFGEVFGPEAADGIAASFKKRLEPNPPTPLQQAMAPLRKEWEELLAKTMELSDRTLAAIQASFLSETVVSSSHAPQKKGALRRIIELSRVGLSHSDIAAFEGMTTKAVAEHLRRARRKRTESTKAS